jgi:RNA polymerase-binding transcription factor DksA
MATAADILGLNRKPTIAREWAAHYRQLCAERDRLVARDCSAPPAAPTKLDDLTDAATEASERDLTLVAANSTHDILFEVVQAIRRIERGAYGMCELTGDPIEAERLEAIPWTRFSLRGQTELERDGLGHKIALPALRANEEVELAEQEGEEEEEAA